MIRWRWVSAVALGSWLGLWGADETRAQSGYTLGVGAFTANAQEQDGCMFAVGQHAFLVLHPSGEPCKLAGALIGRTGRLVFEVDR